MLASAASVLTMCEFPESDVGFSYSRLGKDLAFQRCTVSSAGWAVLTCSPR